MIDLTETQPYYYEKIIDESEKGYQTRLVVSEFRGTEYLHLRRYYMDFEETWQPSNEGISLPLTLQNSQNLFEGLVELLSLAESKTILEDHFHETLDYIYAR
jgi:hypothetical protein